jgi:hypothetical protein
LKNAPPHPGPLPRFAAEREKPAGRSSLVWRMASGRLDGRHYSGIGLRNGEWVVGILTRHIMNDLEMYLKNPFANRHIGMDKLLAFTTNHLPRLEMAGPGGVWPARIAATQAALAAVNNGIVADDTQLGQRKSGKHTKKEFRRALPKRLAAIHVALMARYGERSAEICECFPFGRTGFRRCGDNRLAEMLEALSAAVSARAAELGPELVAQAAALVTEWQPVHDASGAAAATKSATENARRQARSALERELFLNLLALAQQFPGQPETLGRFMERRLLTRKRPRRSARPATEAAGGE